MYWLLIIALIIFLIIDIKLDKNFITPIKIYNILWFVLILLYQLNLSYIQTTLSNRTLFIFWIFTIFYNMFYYLFYYETNKNNKYNEKENIKKYKITTRDFNNEKIIKIVDIFFIAMFIIEIIIEKGFPLLFRLQGKGSNYLSFGIPSIHGLLNTIAMLLGAYYLLKKGWHKYIYIIFAVMTISRQVLITIFVEGVVVYIIQNGSKISNSRNQRRKILILTIIVIVMFTAIGNFRSGNDVMDIVFRPKPQYTNLPTSVMWFYSYLEFSISNFNHLVSMTDGGVNYGTSMLNFFMPSALEKLFSISENFTEKYIITDNFNVSTWYPEIYLDFGIFGIVIFAIVLAWFGNYLYKKAMLYKNDRYSLLYAIFIHNIFMSFFVNMFIYVSVISQAILVIILFNKNEYKSKEKNTENEQCNVINNCTRI